MIAAQIYLDFTRMPKSKRYIESNSRDILFSGGFGCGKSIALCMRAILLAGKYPGTVGGIFRFEGADLRDTTMRTFFDECLPAGWFKRGIWNKQERLFTFPNGSKIMFRDLKNMRGLKSLRLDWGAIDQMEEISREMAELVRGRIGRSKSECPPYFFATCNPEGHNWLWQDYKNKIKIGSLLIEGAMTDNPFLPEEYVAKCLKMPDYWVKRYVFGNWDIFVGQVFDMWDANIHVFDPLAITMDKKWTFGYSIDYGMTNPTAIGIYFRDFAGNIFKVWESYVVNQPVMYHAKMLKNEIEQLMEKGYRIDISMIDPHARNKTREDESKTRLVSIIDDYNDNGIYPIPGNCDFDAGFNNLIAQLQIDSEHIHPITGSKGSPHFYVSKRCPWTIEEFTSYKYKDISPSRSNTENSSERPRKYKDHTVDEARYFCMEAKRIGVNGIEAQETTEEAYNILSRSVLYGKNFSRKKEEFDYARYGCKN